MNLMITCCTASQAILFGYITTFQVDMAFERIPGEPEVGNLAEGTLRSDNWENPTEFSSVYMPNPPDQMSMLAPGSKHDAGGKIAYNHTPLNSSPRIQKRPLLSKAPLDSCVPTLGIGQSSNEHGYQITRNWNFSTIISDRQ